MGFIKENNFNGEYQHLTTTIVRLVSAARERFGRLSLFPALHGLEVQYDVGNEVKEKNEEVIVDLNGERFFVGVRGENSLRVSCRIRETRKTTSWKCYVDWYDGKRDTNLESTISTLLQIEKLNVFSKESEEFTAIRVVIDKNQKVNDSQIQSLVFCILNMDTSKSESPIRIDEIELIEFPVYLIGSFHILVKSTSRKTCDIELYSEFADSILGRWIGISFYHHKIKQKIIGEENLFVEDQVIPNPMRDPPNLIESLIVNTISELGIEIPALQTNPNLLQQTFPKLGMDSIQMAEIEIKLRKIFPEIVFGSILKYNSIEKFGSYLDNLNCSTKGGSALVNEKKNNEKGDPVWHFLFSMGSLPITVQQRQILFLSQLRPEELSQFNEYFYFSLETGNFEEKHLICAARRLMIEETVLRTIFIDDRQIVLSGTEVFLQRENISNDDCKSCLEPIIDPTKEVPIRIFIEEKSEGVRVLIVFHHISVDGISLKILSQRLNTLVTRKMLKNNENRPQFANFALEITQEMILERDRSFWKTHLLDQTHNSLPPLQGSTKAVHARYATWNLPTSVTSIMQKLSIKSGLSMYKLFVASHMATLCKLHDWTEITIGVAEQSRPPGHSKTVGCFVNMLPLRMKYNGESRILEYLKAADKMIGECIEHNIPYGEIVKCTESTAMIGDSNGPQERLLFNIMIIQDILASSMDDGADGYSGQIKLLQPPPRRPKYDQVWFWQRNGSKFSVQVEFDPRKFSENVIKWYLDRVGIMIINLWKSLNERESMKLSSLSPFPRSIHLQHQRGLKNCWREHPEKFSWLEIFTRQTQRTGETSTIIDSKGTITYQQLDRLSTRISHRITQKIWRSMGISPTSDTPVALFCSQSHRRFLLMIAMWKSRLYPFNINMDWPLLKQKANTELFGNILFITENIEHLKESSEMTMDLENLCRVSNDKDRRMWLCNSPEDVMYITCTSGTTGAPKCVVTPFKGHNNLPLAYARSFLISHQSITYQAANYAFDIFFGDLTMSLSHGSNIRIATTGVPALEEMLSSNVSHSYIMPAFLSTLSDSEIKKIGTLERIFFGGEQIQHGVKQKLIHSNTIIYEKYGTSEQTVYSTKYEVKFGSERGLVGLPYPNLYMTSVTSESHLTDGKMISECVQFGAGISRGYHSLPGRNSTRYSLSQLVSREDRHMGRPSRSYFTGDLVSLYHSTCYQFHGRRDTQTKIGGKLVRINEIQEEISSRPGVHSCYVIESRDDYAAFLIAYVRFTGSPLEDKTEELRKTLKERMAPHEIPRFIVQIDVFPLNQNGKVDKAKLPPPTIKKMPEKVKEEAFIEAKAQRKGFGNDLETSVIEVFRRVLGNEKMSLDDEFFQSGGDSIRAMFVVRELGKSTNCHWDIPLRAIYENTTARSLVAYIRDKILSDERVNRSDDLDQNIENLNAINPEVQRDVEEWFPLGKAQAQLWTIQKIESENDQLGVMMRISVSNIKTHSTQALKYSLNHLIAKFSLRKEICDQNPMIRLLSLTEGYVNFENSEKQGESFFQKTNHFEIFSLKSHLFETVDDRKDQKDRRISLEIRLNHLTVDGRSLQILGQSFISAYEKFIKGEIRIDKSENLSPTTFSANSTNTTKEDLDFWAEYLENYTELSLLKIPKLNPSLKLKNALQTIQKALPKTFLNSLKSSRFHSLTTAVVAVLQDSSRSKDITIGGVFANRQPENIDEVGYFVNTLPMRFTKGRQEESFIHHCFNQIDLTLKHQSTLFSDILEKLKIERSEERHPIFNHVVNLRNSSMKTNLVIEGSDFVMEFDESKKNPFEISWIFEENEGGELVLNLLFDPITIQREQAQQLLSSFHKEYKELFVRSVRSHHSPSTSSSISPSIKYPQIPSPSFSKMFLNQALNTPTNISLWCDEQKLTYSEMILQTLWLSRRFTQIGLIKNGIITRSDQIFAYQLPESIISYQLLFAAQFLGLGFLSIHPDSPVNKRKQILEQCNPYLSVTSQDLELMNQLKNQSKNEQIKKIVIFEKATHPDLFYLIYTSGTTGDSKGIAVSEGNVKRMILHFSRMNHVNSRDKTLIFSTPSFDGGMGNILSSPLNGGTICIRSENSHFERLFDMYGDLDSIHCTPTIAHSLFSDPKLRIGRLNVGGEAFTVSLLEKIGDHTVIQLYGPAEATCYQNFLRMKPNHRLDNLGDHHIEYSGDKFQKLKSKSYVLPMNDSEAVKPFELGEFVVRSHQVARGYIAMNGTKNEAFQSQMNTYRTGDMGWIDPNGGLHFLGRQDNQYKINGVRVELAEIERAVGKCEGVEEVHLCVDSTQIIAFYTGIQATPQSLQGQLREWLPYFLLPTHFHHLNSLPRTNNGKVDQRELLRLYNERKDLQEIDSLSPSPFLEKVLQIWVETLSRKNENFNSNSNFFVSGGNSMMAIKLVERLNNEFSISIAFKDVFRYSTPIDMSHHIERILSNGKTQEKERKKPSKSMVQSSFRPDPTNLSKVPSHLSPLVKMLLRTENQSIKISYNCPITLFTKIPLDKSILAFRSILMKHRSLRSFYYIKDEIPLMEVFSGTEAYFLPIESNNRQTKDVENLCYEDDLLIQIFWNGNKNELHLLMSHLIVDGHSVMLIAKEFEALQENRFQIKNSMDLREFYDNIEENVVRSTAETPFNNRLGNSGRFSENPTTKVQKIQMDRNLLKDRSKREKTTEFIVFMTKAVSALYQFSASKAHPITVSYPINLRNGKTLTTAGYGIKTALVNISPNTKKWKDELIDQLTENSNNSIVIRSGNTFDSMIVFDEFLQLDSKHFQVDFQSNVPSKFPITIFVSLFETEITIEAHYWINVFREKEISKLLEEIQRDPIDSSDFRQEILQNLEEILIVNGNIHNLDSIREVLRENEICAQVKKVSDENFELLIEDLPGSKEEFETKLASILPFELLPKEIRFEPKLKMLSNRQNPMVDLEKYPQGFPLSIEQEQMSFLSLNDPENYYLNPYINRFQKPLKTKHFIQNAHKALCHLIQYQIVFRTNFRYSKSKQIQRQEVLSMTESFIACRREEVVEKDLRKAFVARHRRVFSLTKDGPLRGFLLESDESLNVLLLIHHIVIDASGTLLFARYFRDYLSKIESGHLITPEKLEKTYIDYSLEQEKLKAIDEEYKGEVLKGITQAVARKSTKKEAEIVKFDDILQEDLFSVSSSLSVSPFIVLLALLNRIIRKQLKSPVSFGIVSANKPSTYEKIIGYFLNYIVVRVEDEKLTRETLTGIQKKVNELLSSNPAFIILQQEMNKELGNVTHLYDVFLNCRYDLESEENLHLDGMDREIEIIVQKNIAPIDISIDFTKGRVLFEISSTIQGIQETEIAMDLKLELNSLINEMKKPAKQTKVEEIFEKPKKTEYPKMTMSDVFDRQTQRSPNNLCFIEGNSRRYSYEQMNIQLNSLAIQIRRDYLRECGTHLRPDSSIAVIRSKSTRALFECWAIMRAGGCYVPIDSANPKGRIEKILESARCLVSLGESGHGSIISVDHRLVIHKKQWPTLDSEDSVYIIHTSGTTGIPKGSVNVHRGVLNMSSQASRHFFITPHDVTFQFTNFVYDNSVLEYSMAFVNGGALLFDDSPFTPSSFVKNLKKYQISFALLFPGLVQLFSDKEMLELKRLRYWIVGAEKLPKRLFEKGIRIGVNIIQNYGPTETTCFAFFKHMKARDHPNNLGEPINNSGFKLRNPVVKDEQIDGLDRKELLICGDGLMRGYLNREVEKSFVLNGGKRFYDSGDLVYSLPDRRIVFIGRKDAQVKLNGHRVELGEIEAALVGIDGVEQARCLLFDDTLIAFYSGIEIKDICMQLISLIPRHMIPHEIEYLSEMPLTSNCKVDLNSLKEIGQEMTRKRSMKSVSKDQQTDSEEGLGMIVSEVIEVLEESLKKSGIKKEHDFFYVGGNSLNVAVFCERLNERLFINISPKDVYKTPKLLDIAAFILSSRKNHNYKKQEGDHCQEANSGSEAGSEAGSIKQILELIWQNIGAKTEDSSVSFFQSGGTSIKLIEVQNEIFEKFKVKVPLSLLIQFNTIDEMVDLIEANNTNQFGKTIQMVEWIYRGDQSVPKATIVLFHPLFGGGFIPYQHLINNLKSLNLDVFIVQHPYTFVEPPQDDEPFAETLEELVEKYSRELEGKIRGRPILIGSSFGAKLAYQYAVKHLNGLSNALVISVDGAVDGSSTLHSFDQHTTQMRRILENWTGGILQDQILLDRMIRSSWDLLVMASEWKPPTISNDSLSMVMITVDGSALEWDQHLSANQLSIEPLPVGFVHDNMLDVDHSPFIASIIQKYS